MILFNLPNNSLINAAILKGTFYIDAVNGNDIRTGKSEADAWKSFSNINKSVLSAGTKILLQRGSVWNKRLEIRGSGTVNNWISVGSYGNAVVRPKISLKNNRDDIAILICDLDKTTGEAKAQPISYIEIKDLEIENTRLGIYYRSVMNTSNIGFRVSNVIFNNINCDEVMIPCNAGTDKHLKNRQISLQLKVPKGNLQTVCENFNGGINEFIFPAAIFVGGKTLDRQLVNGSHSTVLSEFEVTNCQFNEAIAGVMSFFYWPFRQNDGANAWRQIVSKVRITNCTATGAVNGALAFDGVNGGAIPDSNGVMRPDKDGWGLIENLAVTRGASLPGRTWPNGTTGVIFSSTQNFLIDKCEFSGILNQGNPDGCGFDFETNNHQVTLQNSKFFNNDGHAILLMNGGAVGGNSDITIQNNLFSNNLKSSDSEFDLLFSLDWDGNKNVKVRNNISFLRPFNKEDKPIGFVNPDRKYITATNNEIYYLDEKAPLQTIHFLGIPYSFNANKK